MKKTNNKAIHNTPILIAAGIMPMLFCFFTMGFVDFVGIATNYIQKDFALSDTLANTLPMMVFVWFAVFPIPTAILMNKIGRKNAVLLSLLLTLLGLLLPILSYNFPIVLAAFGLIGISNTIMQTSLNPLVTNVVAPNRLASTLTLGQFVKAIASFLGPILSGIMAKQFGDWKLTFIVFAVATVVSGVWLLVTKIPQESESESQANFGKTLSLLKDKYVLLLFSGILLIVGIDVGLNTSIPKLLMAQTGMELEDAGMGTTCYFIARTIGTFIGAMLLVRVAGNKFLTYSMLIATIALILLALVSNIYSMYAMIFIIGFACANVFSIIFSYALRYKKDSTNEISALMIMGIAGGALITPLMGWIADFGGQVMSLSVLLLCMVYLWFMSLKVR